MEARVGQAWTARIWKWINTHAAAIAVAANVLSVFGAVIYVKQLFWHEAPIVEQMQERLPKLFRREPSDPVLKGAIKGLETVETQGQRGRDAVKEWRKGERALARELLENQAKSEQGKEAADHFHQLALLYLLEDSNKFSAPAKEALNNALKTDHENAEIWSNKATFEKSISELDNAENSYRTVLDITSTAKKSEKRDWLFCFANAGIADIYRNQSRFSEASILLQQTLNSVGSNEMLSEVYGELGLAKWQLGDLYAAKTNIVKSLDLNIKYGNLFHLIADLSTLGRIYTDLGRLDESRWHLDKAYDLYLTYVSSDVIHGTSPVNEANTTETMRQLSWLIYVYRNFGDLYYAKSVYLSDNSLDQAEDFYRRSLEIANQVNSSEGLMIAHIDLGYIALARGNEVEAEEHFKKGFENEDKISRNSNRKNYLPLGRLHGGLGAIALARSDLKMAEHEFVEAVDQFNNAKSVSWLAEGYANMGKYYEAIHNHDKACKYWSDARDIYSRIGMILARNRLDQTVKGSCLAR
jgi:tetratricopeptide (TPR) repeat protein